MCASMSNTSKGLGWAGFCCLPLALAQNLTCDSLPYAAAPGRLFGLGGTLRVSVSNSVALLREALPWPQESQCIPARDMQEIQRWGTSGGQNLRCDAEPTNMPRLFSQQVWGRPSSDTTWPHQLFSIEDRAQSLHVKCVCVHSLKLGGKEGWRL